MTEIVKKYPDFPPEPVYLHKFNVNDEICKKNKPNSVKYYVVGVCKDGYMLSITNNHIGILPFSEEELYEKIEIKPIDLDEMFDGSVILKHQKQ